MTEKIYMQDPYLTEIRAKVISKEEKEDGFHIVLDKTIFYPEGLGGQKGDIGTLNDYFILKAYEENDAIYHVIKEDISENFVCIKINEVNRLKIMQQHTTQHLVSQVFIKIFNTETIGFHGSDKYVTVDLDIENLSKEDLIRVENISNEIVQKNLKVFTYFPNKDELSNLNLRKDPKVKDNIRIVEIDSFDRVPCGGTHVTSTGQLGLIKIVDSSRQNGKTRLTIVSGILALEDYRDKENIVDFLNKDLSSNKDNLLEKYEKFIDNYKSLQESHSKLKDKYLDLYKKELQSTIINKKYLLNVFNDLKFDDLNNLSKKFEKENLLLVFLLQGDKSKYRILVNNFSNNDLILKDFKSFMESELNFKGGGGQSSLQGIIMEENLDKITSYIEEFLNKNWK